jgi:transketolase
VLEVDGHDMGAVVRVLEEATVGDGRPVAIIANTIKGRGVSFMEGRYYWHTRPMTADELVTAMAELGEPVSSPARVTA